MAKLVKLRDRDPSVRVFVRSEGDLELGTVSRFLQRLDTGTRRIASDRGVAEPRVGIVSLTTGSLDLRLRLEARRVGRMSIAISAACLTVAIAGYLRNDPAAARACRDLVVGDNATVIEVEGGGTRRVITSRDLDAANEERVAAARPAPVEVIRGWQPGFLRRIAGEDWVELDSHPGLIIRIRDRRPEARLLQEDLPYRFDGEAHIAREGGGSYFLLKDTRDLR